MDALAKPDDPEYADEMEWLGDYDSELFNLAVANKRLSRW